MCQLGSTNTCLCSSDFSALLYPTTNFYGAKKKKNHQPLSIRVFSRKDTANKGAWHVLVATCINRWQHPAFDTAVGNDEKLLGAATWPPSPLPGSIRFQLMLGRKPVQWNNSFLFRRNNSVALPSPFKPFPAPCSAPRPKSPHRRSTPVKNSHHRLWSQASGSPCPRSSASGTLNSPHGWCIDMLIVHLQVSAEGCRRIEIERSF